MASKSRKRKRDQPPKNSIPTSAHEDDNSSTRPTHEDAIPLHPSTAYESPSLTDQPRALINASTTVDYVIGIDFGSAFTLAGYVNPNDVSQPKYLNGKHVGDPQRFPHASVIPTIVAYDAESNELFYGHEAEDKGIIINWIKLFLLSDPHLELREVARKKLEKINISEDTAITGYLVYVFRALKAQILEETQASASQLTISIIAALPDGSDERCQFADIPTICETPPPQLVLE